MLQGSSKARAATLPARFERAWKTGRVSILYFCTSKASKRLVKRETPFFFACSIRTRVEDAYASLTIPQLAPPVGAP